MKFSTLFFLALSLFPSQATQVNESANPRPARTGIQLGTQVSPPPSYEPPSKQDLSFERLPTGLEYTGSSLHAELSRYFEATAGNDSPLLAELRVEWESLLATRSTTGDLPKMSPLYDSTLGYDLAMSLAGKPDLVPPEDMPMPISLIFDLIGERQEPGYSELRNRWYASSQDQAAFNTLSPDFQRYFLSNSYQRDTVNWEFALSWHLGAIGAIAFFAFMLRAARR